jgi:SPP1 family predicted phage head-tail adaptor
MRIYIGDLDERIEFRQRTSVRDEFGGMSETYLSVSEAWCKVIREVKEANNEEVGGRQVSDRSIEFIVRYRTDLNEDLIIKYDDELGIKFYKIQKIEQVPNTRRKSFIKIRATKYDINK